MRNQLQPSNQAVQWTSGAKRAALDYMRVNHDRAHVGMTQERLDWGMPYIIGKKYDRLGRIKNLREKRIPTSGIKEQIARLFAKTLSVICFSISETDSGLGPIVRLDRDL